MQNSKLGNTPLATHFKLSCDQPPAIEVEKKEMASIPYSTAIGSLRFAMIGIRSDLTYSIS